MKKDIIIVNDFYRDPDGVVSMAKSMDYYLPYDRGELPDSAKVRWRSTRWKPASDCPFKSSRKLVRTLEEITGETIDLAHWNKDFPVDRDGFPEPWTAQGTAFDPDRACLWNCSFHAKHQNCPPGTFVHRHNESETWTNVTADGWAGVVYLTRKADFAHGLYTWQNADPTSTVYERNTDPSRWKKVDELGFVYNRLILHRGGLPHSGGTGWGDSLENGRFFQTFFFRTLGVKKIEAVSVP